MTSHYFDASPSGPDERVLVNARIRGRDWEFWTAPGVFSKDGLDKATSVLLEHLEAPGAGHRVLDLGCGWGPVACVLAASGSETWAVDVNERARELTAANAEHNGLEVHVTAPDEVPAELVFDEIWSNPPVRIGKKALHELLLDWLPRLSEGGRTLLVVGKNLGSDSLQRWLVEQGWPTVRLTSVKGFRVLEVQRSADGTSP